LGFTVGCEDGWRDGWVVQKGVGMGEWGWVGMGMGGVGWGGGV
jgi:hypothetical protein